MMGNLERSLVTYVEKLVGAHAGNEKSMPPQIKIPEYPAGLIDEIFDDANSHALLTMTHTDTHGNPFPSVMGFSFIDGKIRIVSRPNAIKNRQLQKLPGFGIIYHNNYSRPERLACITLMGRAEVSEDKAMIARANEALSRKTFRDNDPDVDRRDAMIQSMNDAERVLITMAEINAIYIVSPMLPGLPAGIPTPVISWRADRKT